MTSTTPFARMERSAETAARLHVDAREARRATMAMARTMRVGMRIRTRMTLMGLMATMVMAVMVMLAMMAMMAPIGRLVPIQTVAVVMAPTQSAQMAPSADGVMVALASARAPWERFWSDGVLLR